MPAVQLLTCPRNVWPQRDLSEFLRRAARAVARGITLNAPALLQRPGVDCVEAELIQEMRDGCLRTGVITGDHQRAAVLATRRLAVGRQFGCVNMVEGLDDLRGRQMCLQEFRSRRRFVSSSGMWPSR